MLSYENHKETIDREFTMAMGAVLLHKKKQVGFMSRSAGETPKLYSQGCQEVKEPRMVCSPCKKLNRLIQRVARCSGVVEAPAENTTQVEAPVAKLSVEKRVETPICGWEECEAEEQFDSILSLNYHLESHIPRLANIPEHQRTFICQWRGCKMTKAKRKQLVAHVKSAHSGEDNDEQTLHISKEISENARRPKQARRWSDDVCDRLNSCVGAGN